MTIRIFYAPTFIDESVTRPDRRGRQEPTGRLSGMVFTREFSMTKARKIRSRRGIVSFYWETDTPEAKAAALAKVIERMDGELPELDNNPPTTWIPEFIKEEMQNEVSKKAVC